MVVYRIQALLVRYGIMLKRDINRVCDIIAWPFIDIVTWGFISVWLARDLQTSSAAAIPLFGMFFWQGVFNQTNMGISVSVLDELFGRNLSSLIASPLKLFEWLCTLMLFGALRMLAVLCVGVCTLRFVFDTSVFSLGWSLLPAIGLLMLSGWAIGCMTAALILAWGNQASAFIWATWIFTAFTGVFTPVDVLPNWMQRVSMCLPMTYPLQIVHHYLTTRTVALDILFKGLCVNGLYVALGVALFVWRFNCARRYGLSRLEVE